MKLQTFGRNTGIAAAALALSVSLAACGSEDDGEATDTETPAETSEAPEPEPTEPESEPAGDMPFGEGCAEVPTSGEGSVEGMVDDPVATAASNNPLLATLVAAVGEAGLVETLNSAPELTVFAPAEPAFADIPKKDVNALLADKEALTSVLTYHVVEGKLDPTAVVGEQTSLQGGTVMVEGDPEAGMTVNGANVICGNVQTANATVYVIDGLLMPPA